jgi:hypothetical protein
MVTEGAKLRFAMGVFEDLARLNSAADALMDLGLDPADLCFMVERAVAPADTANVWMPAEQNSHVAWFQHRGPALAAPPGGWFAGNAAWLIAAAIEAAVTSRPYRSPASDVWSTMSTHLADGALLLVARLPSASLQDQAVRALLRYSRQPVHAEEFFSPAELG